MLTTYIMLAWAAITMIGPAPMVINDLPKEEVKIEPIKMQVWTTAYSSTPEETDDTPFITASGKEVRDGIVAANFLPLGSKIQIPEVFGDRVFIVEDRMHPRKKDFVDVWMPSKDLAIKFGIRQTEIVLLD